MRNKTKGDDHVAYVRSSNKDWNDCFLWLDNIVHHEYMDAQGFNLQLRIVSVLLPSVYVRMVACMLFFIHELLVRYCHLGIRLLLERR